MRGLAHRPGLLLAGGLLVGLAANGRLAAWPAAWLSGLLLVRYFRTASGWAPWVLGALGFFGLGCVSWFALMPFPPPLFLSIQVKTALLGLVPFALDRLTHARTHGAWWQTLVFPLTATALEFHSYMGSGTTWGALGYTQVGFLPLSQLASVTGLWGVGFMVSWFASWGSTAWEELAAGRGVRRGGLVYPALLATIVLGGAWRLAASPRPAADPVAIAAVSPPDLLDILEPEQLGLFQAHYMKQEIPADALERISGTLAGSYAELFEKTRREARAGAEVVFWPEASVIALGTEQHEDLVAKATQLADEEDIYLGATLAYIPDDREELNRNRILLLDPEGRAAGEYHKTRLIPEVEEPFTRPGSGTIVGAETPLAHLGLAICYDLDDPGFVATLDSRVELLVAPSGDWSAIKYLHSAMARFRSIEMGVPLFRPANHGLSQAVDTRGRATATMDHDTTTDRVLRTTVQPGRVPTLYGRWGDAFPWLCVVALPVLLGLCWWAGRRLPSPDAVSVAP